MANAIVFAHASASTGRQWSALAGGLGTRYRVLAPDFAGGVSGDSLEQDIAVLGEAIAAAAGPVHLVGHSYGGAVAALAALRHPRRVASLSLFEPVCFWLLRDDARGAGPQGSSSDAAWREIVTVATGLAADRDAGRSDKAARDFVDYWSGAGAWEVLPGRQRQSVAQRVDSVLSNFDCLSAERTPLAALARLPMPVLWLGGARSPGPALRIGELLGQALPQMTRYLLPGVGHMGPLTHPGLVGSLIAGFVGAQRARSAVPGLRKAA